MSLFTDFQTCLTVVSRTGSYIGLFQLSRSEFRKYGSGDVASPRDNAVAAAYKLVTEATLFELYSHREPTVSELYLIHQQGWRKKSRPRDWSPQTAFYLAKMAGPLGALGLPSRAAGGPSMSAMAPGRCASEAIVGEKQDAETCRRQNHRRLNDCYRCRPWRRMSSRC